MEEQVQEIAEILKVLANANRLLILCQLIKGPKTVTMLQEAGPKISQSALSQHLALLKAHGILASAKTGQNVTYAIADHRVEALIAALKQYYCR